MTREDRRIKQAFSRVLLGFANIMMFWPAMWTLLLPYRVTWVSLWVWTILGVAARFLSTYLKYHSANPTDSSESA